jgi:nucleoside-diphosphate-sugar epimerase
MDKINLNDKTLLVTGAAGFIGSNLVKRLLRDVKGATIIGIREPAGLRTDPTRGTGQSRSITS